MVEVPDAFARTVVEREGQPGQDWLDSLPALLDDLLARWRCTPTDPIIHGAVGVILPVRRDDGVAAVLKVSFPHPGNRYEAEAFATWGGRGAVRLYERDDTQFAMLLEQGEWQTLDDLGDPRQATGIIGDLARRLAVPAPAGLPRLADRADEWERSLRAGAEAADSISERALDVALETVRDLVRSQPETMVHGDLHFGNVVRAEREPWLVVDPKGLVGDLASDSFRVLVRGVDSLIASDDFDAEVLCRLGIFADAAGIERERAIRWAQLDSLLGAYRARTAHEPDWVVQIYDRGAELLAARL